jgi:hypothetical protein
LSADAGASSERFADRAHECEHQEPSMVTLAFTLLAILLVLQSSDDRARARSRLEASGQQRPAPTRTSSLAFADDSIAIDTANVILGPPIGTNTTGQQAAGPLCV